MLPCNVIKLTLYLPSQDLFCTTLPIIRALKTKQNKNHHTKTRCWYRHILKSFRLPQNIKETLNSTVKTLTDQKRLRQTTTYSWASFPFVSAIAFG